MYVLLYWALDFGYQRNIIFLPEKKNVVGTDKISLVSTHSIYFMEK